MSRDYHWSTCHNPHGWWHSTGGHIKIKLNGETIAEMENGEHCLDNVTTYDIIQLQRTSDGTCISSLSINNNQLLFGENNDLQYFWFHPEDEYCSDDFMSSSLIEIQNGQIISSACKNRKYRNTSKCHCRNYVYARIK